MLLYFLLLLRVISWFESQKCMIKPYHTIWPDIDSNLRSIDSKWLDNSCDSTKSWLASKKFQMTLTRRTCDSESTKVTWHMNGIRRTRWLLMVLGQRGRQKVEFCDSESDESIPKTGNEHGESEWNTRSCSYSKDNGTTLFQVWCRRVNIFFAYTRQAMSQFGTNFIHVINLSNVQNSFVFP